MNSLIIKGGCTSHENCPNEFYMEWDKCTTCGIYVNVDQEFNEGDEIEYGCPNCGDLHKFSV